MAISPFAQAYEAVVINAIWAIQPVLTPVQGLVDEYGQALTVLMRAIYPERVATLPEVVVAFEAGSVVFGQGNNGLSTDLVQSQTNNALQARGSRIVLTVRARSDPERRYILDTLMMGIVSNYAVDYVTDPAGTTVEAIVRAALAGTGIFTTGLGPPRYAPTVPDDPRPEGQVWLAELPLLCDVWITWQTPLQPQSADITVQQTVTTGWSQVPATAEQPADAVTLPAYTV